VELYFLNSAGATRFYQKTYGHDVLANGYFRLSDDQTRVLTWISKAAEGYEGAYAAVIDLNGVTLRRRTFKHFAQVLDFSGTRVVMSEAFGPARIWRLGHRPHVIASRRASLASFERNTLATKGSTKRWKMASISRPHHVRWQARFQPVRISPNGRRVVGFSTSKPGRPVEVRRMRNGRLLSTWKFTGIIYSDSDLTWESNQTILGDAAQEPEGTWVVVRCRVRAGCERASEPTPAPIQFKFRSA
jgi:hypothetical protein